MPPISTTAPNTPTVLFLGSFLEYSALVLEALAHSPLINLVGVITTPPMPAGRAKTLTPTHVQQKAEALGLPVASPELLNPTSLQATAQSLGLATPPDILLTAGYGKLLPDSWLTYPVKGALNLHFSLLPSYRGANPAEWALLHNQPKTGVTVITMSPQFDTGAIIGQAETPITSQDTRETIYTKLYTQGGAILPTILRDWAAGTLTAVPQPEKSPTPYAKRFTREDSFISWEGLVAAQAGKTIAKQLLAPLLAKALSRNLSQTVSAADIERAVRALAGFPGIWTELPTKKGPVRMKLLSTSLEQDENNCQKLKLGTVHIAGQQPAAWKQVKTIVVSANES